MKVKVKAAGECDWDEAILLAKHTFSLCNNEDCTKEGKYHFFGGLDNKQLFRVFLNGFYPMFCAFSEDKMVGMITIRNDNHVSLLFVDEHFQKQGIGNQLLCTALEYCFSCKQYNVTVNASRVAVDFYKKNKFYVVEKEYLDNGVYVTPMKCTLSTK